MVGEHGDQGNHGREQELRRAANGLAYTAGKEARAFRHTCAEHHHKHIAKWMEVGEGFWHFNPKALNVFSR